MTLVKQKKYSHRRRHSKKATLPLLIDIPTIPLEDVNKDEDIFTYIDRKYGKFDMRMYRNIVGAANEFKEADSMQGLCANNPTSRSNARKLISNTPIYKIHEQPLFKDEIQQFIWDSVDHTIYERIKNWTIHDLKNFLLKKKEDDIKNIIDGLCSDVIACLVKISSNDELCIIGSKIFNPLPGTNIGAKGYLGARIQPNSPSGTSFSKLIQNVDDVVDIMWQVFSGWSYGVGDVVLGTNPVDGTKESIAAIEGVLRDIILTFQLENVIPWCVLSHIDTQVQIDNDNPGSVKMFFQSIAGSVASNKTFDVSLQNMIKYVKEKNIFYFETGQGSEFTNGHGDGVDVVVYESRKYGFAKALNKILKQKNGYCIVNDVSGFIGPEVFRTKEQLVRTCLEDLIMGKLHGLMIGLDVCATLHMEISPHDLDWCLDQIMPANPGYLMALPTKNDPMLGYLTTGFHDHVRLRNKFGFKINEKMMDFFQRIEVLDKNGKPTKHFGDPIWVYLRYKRAKGDERPEEIIRKEGEKQLKQVIAHGVPIPMGHGKNIWDLPPAAQHKLNTSYLNAKKCLLAEFSAAFKKSMNAINVQTLSRNRQEYIMYPKTGEVLDKKSINRIMILKREMEKERPNIQIVISDGLNALSIVEEGQLLPFLEHLKKGLIKEGFIPADTPILVTNGRVRVGYKIGELLFSDGKDWCGIIHVIGERPGTEHLCFSAYLVGGNGQIWKKGVDHDIAKVVSGIAKESVRPIDAAYKVVKLLKLMRDGEPKREKSIFGKIKNWMDFSNWKATMIAISIPIIGYGGYCVYKGLSSLKKETNE